MSATFKFKGPAEPSGTKWCPQCDEVKPLGAFWKSKRGRLGRNSYCATCAGSKRNSNGDHRSKALARYYRNRERCNEQRKQSRKENPEKHREYNRKSQGILNPTGEIKIGPCEICESVCKLNFDHNHHTGLFRGWLCFTCNTRLGWWERIIEQGLQSRVETYLTRGLEFPEKDIEKLYYQIETYYPHLLEEKAPILTESLDGLALQG